jgi:hypothetical protein
VNHLGGSAGIFPPKLSVMGGSQGSSNPRVQAASGCHLSCRLSSVTLPGASLSGYRVVGSKFRRFPPILGPLNPCAYL